MDENKYLCNYCFVAECLDINPDKISETKCSGLTKEQSEKGLACDFFSNKIMEADQ